MQLYPAVRLLLLLLSTVASSGVMCSVIIVDSRNVVVERYRSYAAFFGPHPTRTYTIGYLRKASPNNACSGVHPVTVNSLNRSQSMLASVYNSTANSIGYFAMVARGGCDFDKKVYNAQLAGYSGVIVYNTRSTQSLVRMSSSSPLGHQIKIPSMMVSFRDAGFMIVLYTNVDNFTAILDFSGSAEPSFNAAGILIPFAIVIALCFLLMSILLVFRWYRDYRRKQRGRLPTRDLKKLVIKHFRKGDAYDTCAICLDDYEDNEKVRQLPCEHIYHIKCIDHWLTKRKRTCPICKRKVFATGNESDSEDAYTSDEDETVNNVVDDREDTPLLGSPIEERNTVLRRLLTYFRSPRVPDEQYSPPTSQYGSNHTNVNESGSHTPPTGDPDVNKQPSSEATPTATTDTLETSSQTIQRDEERARLQSNRVVSVDICQSLPARLTPSDGAAISAHNPSIQESHDLSC